MNKKIVKILSIFLVLISISTMCYAGYVEVNINEEEIQINFFQRIITVLKCILECLLQVMFTFFDRVHYGFFGISLDFYLGAGIILIYAILNLLIVRKKKELAKISLKINGIVILILLVIITMCFIIQDIIIFGFRFAYIGLTLLIISLIFQKIIVKKDDEKIKKYNRILKRIMVVLIVIEIISYIILYMFMYHIYSMHDLQRILLGEVSFHKYMYGIVDSRDPILVKEITAFEESYPPRCYTRKWTTAEEEEIFNREKVLNIDEEGVLIQYTDYNYVPEEGVSDIDFLMGRGNYKIVKEEKEIKLKWDTWYRKIESRDPSANYNKDTYTYIRVTKNK